MNRPGAGPQSLRGVPGSFGGHQQQHPQQQGRSVSSRLPNGKLGAHTGNTAGGWAFGGNVPMGSAGFQNQNQARQQGGNVSFAQSLSGSQPTAPLDMSEFPSLSNNSQMNNANQSSMWSSSGARNLSGPVQRNQSTPVSSQQDDLFGPGPSRMPSNQSAFRFGNQSNGPSAAQGQSGTADEFPPLNRGGNGEIGSERGGNPMASLGFGSQQPTSGGMQTQRGNGLLNALSANSQANDARSAPIGAQSRQQDAKRPNEEGSRQKSAVGSGLTAADSMDAGDAKDSDPLKEGQNGDAQEVIDPLAGMSPVDKWGIKGLRMLMNNYPDYHAMVVGMDPSSLGLDLGSQELISTQVYSLFDETPPRPTVNGSKFRLPDCYNVTNVQPIESKIQSFNEETLFWIFYSCTADVKQNMAAVELHNRNWRWHKKMQIWLTKDEHMNPQILSPNHERGYYIVWDSNTWRKDRREFTLHYGDLDTTLSQTPAIP